MFPAMVFCEAAAFHSCMVTFGNTEKIVETFVWLTSFARQKMLPSSCHSPKLNLHTWIQPFFLVVGYNLCVSWMLTESKQPNNQTKAVGAVCP